MDSNNQQCHTKLKYIQAWNNFSIYCYIFIHESNITASKHTIWGIFLLQRH